MDVMVAKTPQNHEKLMKKKIRHIANVIAISRFFIGIRFFFNVITP